MNSVMRTALKSDLQEVIDGILSHIDDPLSDAMHRLAADYVHNDDQTSRKLYRVGCGCHERVSCFEQNLIIFCFTESSVRR